MLSGRLAFMALRPFIKRFTKPRTRVLVTDGHGQVLLMRGWFGRQRWDLPGGGIKRGETAVAAAIREVWEETGIRLHRSQLERVGEFSPAACNLSHGIILFRAQAPHGPVGPRPAFRFEVLEAGWWPGNRLPTDSNVFVSKALRKVEST